MPEPRSLAFSSIQEAQEKLERAGYWPSKEISTSAYLAECMSKPVLVEGPAGVGKTEFAKALARATHSELIRLQCYEGLDESKALYEWEYSKQLLYTQLLKDKIEWLTQGTTTLKEAAEKLAGSESVFFSEAFLLERPLLKAIRSKKETVLLIDEIDKADPEFEAFLLEVLAENTVTLPEIGTLTAHFIPRVVLTSNNTRELSDALKRRCLHLYIDFPTQERELKILRSRLPNIEEALLQQVTRVLTKLRELELKKSPAIGEAIDWAQALALLNADVLDSQLLTSTLQIVLKHETDVTKAKAHLSTLVDAARQ